MEHYIEGGVQWWEEWVLVQEDMVEDIEKQAKGGQKDEKEVGNLKDQGQG